MYVCVCASLSGARGPFPSKVINNVTQLYAGGRSPQWGAAAIIHWISLIVAPVLILTLWLLGNSDTRVRLIGLSVTHYVYDSEYRHASVQCNKGFNLLYCS